MPGFALHTYSILHMEASMSDPTPARAAALDLAKRTTWAALTRLPGPDFGLTCRELLASDVQWHVSHPIDTLVGPEAVAEGFFAPLAVALPDLERRTDIFIGGHWDGYLVWGRLACG